MANESQGFSPEAVAPSKPVVTTNDVALASMANVPSDTALPTNNINALRPDTNRVPLKHGARPEGSKPRPCRPTIIPFDTEKFINIYLRLEYLKNLDSEDLPHPGDYIVRVMCMGQVYGHFPSGNMDLRSMVNYARSDPSQRRSPDVLLSHEVTFCIKFKDLVDNPLVFHLCYAGDIIPELHAALPAFGFICLDVARLLNYKTGMLSEHSEPWIIPDTSKANGLNIQINPSAPIPTLQLSVECIGGLPDNKQLLQGNMMTVLCESVHNMPQFVQQNIAHSDNLTDVQVFMTLPHSQTEPLLKFPGGKLKESFPFEPVPKKISLQDEATQTIRGSINGGESGSPPSAPEAIVKDGKGQIPQALRFWASVKEYSSDIPMEATAMAFDPSLDSPDTTEDSEIYGDGREDYMEFVESGDSRIVWNSVHRKYIAVDSYRNMLGKLSQNAIWPIEIAVAVKKKAEVKKKRTEKSAKSMLLSPYGPNVDGQTSATYTGAIESNERMIMAELGQAPNASANSNDYTLVFHGIAFVDLSCLVYPGTKSARFACRVLPFSSDLIARRTCLTASAVPENLLLTLAPKASVENKLNKQSTIKPPAQAQAVPGKVRTSMVATTLEVSPQRKSDFTEAKSRQTQNPGVEIPSSDAGPQERNCFIVFRISMLRSIVPCYKSNTEISKVVNDFLPRRQLMRRKLLNASSAQQKYRKAILEAAAELSHEFSEHYWKEVLQNGQTSDVDRSSMDPSSNEAVKKGFIFYLNASGRYLILREHLRTSISHLVQQKCLNLRPSGFQNHRDFQSYLHDMYVFLVDEMHDILNSSSLQETDPLKSNLDRLLQQTNCGPDEEFSKSSLHQRQITDLGIFAEEAFAQGDFETCHKLHLQRICKDKESARCWTEFAIMWLSRGDDRMAEIAVREALRKDPLHLYALLISGVISVRHGDERGLECLGAALGLRPMAPEILVIVGVANSLIGNDIAADYFFRKAAYVHRRITGQSTEDLEKLFSEKNTRRPFNLKDFAKDLEDGTLSGKSASPETSSGDSTQNLSEPVMLAESTAGDVSRKPKDRSKTKVKRGSKADGSINQGRTKSKYVAQEEDDDAKRTSSKLKRKSSSVKDQKPSILSQLALPATEVAPTAPPTNGPKFSFLENLNDILLEEVEMPFLSPSIQSPWNVTEYSEKMERILLIKGDKVKKGSKSGSAGFQNKNKSGASIANSQNLGADGARNLEDLENLDERGTGSGSLGSGSDKLQGIESTSTFSSNPVRSDGKRKSSKTGREKEKEKERERGQGDSNSKTQIKTSKDEEGISIPVPIIDEKEKVEYLSPDQPRLTNRLGSELIWAANLLVNLRLFDFLDGVLAKELFFYDNRTVQFSYLRAVSFYLRQREEEALPLIKEATDMDNANGIYWALEGHCHYNLGNIPEAMGSYEKALKLPHANENRHLLYLRYGSLVLDGGKTKLAKRVFLHGVSKYPTPYMWLALGSACFQRLEYDQAESSFSEANRLDSTNPITWGHLALSSLMQNKQALAEQAYKWALRFGLKKGVLMDEIQRVQSEKGFGDPSFPRIPNCVPHEYYLRRMGKQKPFNIYREALNQDPPRMNRDRYDDTENEELLKRKLEMMSNASMIYDGEEWEGEGYYSMPQSQIVMPEEEYREPEPPPTEPEPRKKPRGKHDKGEKTAKPSKHSAPPDLVTIKNPPRHPSQNSTV